MRALTHRVLKQAMGRLRKTAPSEPRDRPAAALDRMMAEAAGTRAVPDRARLALTADWLRAE